MNFGRTKSKRTRIKERRAKRNRRKFYHFKDGKMRARRSAKLNKPIRVKPPYSS